MSSEYASPARTETSLTISLLKIGDSSTVLGITRRRSPEMKVYPGDGFPVLSHSVSLTSSKLENDFAAALRVGGMFDRRVYIVKRI
jgi:hypothetical protein